MNGRELKAEDPDGAPRAGPSPNDDETRPPAWLLWLYVAYIVWAGAYLALYLFGE